MDFNWLWIWFSICWILCIVLWRLISWPVRSVISTLESEVPDNFGIPVSENFINWKLSFKEERNMSYQRIWTWQENHTSDLHYWKQQQLPLLNAIKIKTLPFNLKDSMNTFTQRLLEINLGERWLRKLYTQLQWCYETHNLLQQQNQISL